MRSQLRLEIIHEEIEQLLDKTESQYPNPSEQDVRELISLLSVRLAILYQAIGENVAPNRRSQMHWIQQQSRENINRLESLTIGTPRWWDTFHELATKLRAGFSELESFDQGK